MASILYYLCFGFFSKFDDRSSRSSLLVSDRSGILALGPIEKGAADSIKSDRIPLGDLEVLSIFVVRLKSSF